MSAPKNHRQRAPRLANQNTGREEQEMSAPATLGQSKLNGAIQGVKTTLEEIEMKLAVDINNIKTILSPGLAAKVLGGLALGAVLMTATALPFGTAYADGPSRPLVTEETLIEDGADNWPDDAWMYNTPFLQDFSEVPRIGGETAAMPLQDIPDDTWMSNSPFHQDFSEVGRIGVGTNTLDDRAHSPRRMRNFFSL